MPLAILWHGVSAPWMGLLLDRGSALEDPLWAEIKRRNIPVERQEYVQVNDNMYALDFARYCNSGKIEVETASL